MEPPPSTRETSTRKTLRTRASVLFADLKGFTALSDAMGPEQAYLVVTGCLRLLDEVARKRGGSVDKYLGDALMAVFGHPVPLEDHAGAAVEAALEMRQRVRDYARELRLPAALELHAGVNTGSFVAGDIHGPVIREFHVLGDAVNVAARLKQRAPLGCVYVGAETYERTRERFAYRDLEPLQLKGKAGSVATYEVLSAREGAARRRSDELALAALVGRETELARLREAVAALAGGRGSVVSLVGSDGLGKSRLVAELARSEAARSVAFLEARPGPRAADAPLQPFADLVREWAGLREGEESTASARLEAALRELGGDAVRELLPPLASLAGVGSGRSDWLRRRRGSGTAPTAAALARWLAALGEKQPRGLVFEDLDRAPAEALALLEELLPLASRAPILFLLVSRPTPAEAAARLLGRVRAEGVEIQLEPLPRAEAETLVQRLAPELEAELRGVIVERAGGSPQRLILGAFLAPALRSELERARAGDRSAEAERRRATVLFADITGFTRLTEQLGDELAYAIIADALALLDDVARKHGGSVDKYLGDCVLALFGVPEAIEDAPRAALNAALEMRGRIAEFNRERGLAWPLDVHSGINTGLGIAGDISGPLIREFAVMGDPVNVADRLKDLSPAGQIWVGAETWRFAREAFEFRALGLSELGDSGAGLEAFELLSQEQRLYRRRVEAARGIGSALVGRDPELARLRECVAGLVGGAGGIVSLVGEAGLGKSRLVAELRAAPEAQDVAWLEGRSLSVGQQLAFHPFGDLGRAWAEIRDEDAPEELPGRVRDAARRLLADAAEEVWPFLATVMGVPLPPEARARVEGVPGEMQDRMIRAAMTQLLRAASQERPLVLVFDDLHWADLSSVELLESLLKLAASHPILFVHVLRPGFTATSGRLLAFARAQHAERHLEVSVEPLAPEASRLLVNNLFQHADIPHRVRTLIAEKAAGNPFYVEEVVRSLVEEGAVELRDGGFRATPKIHDVVLPGTLQEVIMARVDRLGLRPKQILQVASVVGRSFHYDVLLRVFPSRDELDAVVAALVDAQFLVPWDRLQGVEYAFKHPLIQEVTYDSLLHGKREELHRRIGDAIQAALDPGVPGFHAMLAYHFSLGRDLERAEEALFRAGDEAARSAASNEALHFFQEASKLYLEVHGGRGDPRKQATLEKNVARAMYNRGLVEPALVHFDGALRHLGERVPQGAWLLNARFAKDLAALLARLYLMGRGLGRSPASERQREIIEIMFQRGQSQVTAAPMRMVFDSLATLRRLSKVDARSVPGAGAMYAGAVAIFSYGGVSFGIGRRFLELARQVIDPESDPGSWLFFRFVNFVHHFLAGDWSAEHEIDDATLEEGLRGGRLYDVANYLGFAAEKALRQGRFDAARAKIEWFREIFEKYEYEPAKLGWLGLSILLLLEERRLDEAAAAADRYNEESQQDLLHLVSLGYKATAKCLAGELDAAAPALARADDLMARTGRPIPYHLGSVLAARLRLDLVELEAALARGDRDAERRLRRRAARSASRGLRIVPKVAHREPELARLAGRHAWLAGRHDRALAHWRRSLAAAASLGLEPERARTHQEVGLRLASGAGPRELDGRGAEAHLAEARRGFESLGLAWDLARLEGAAPP
jgi:class 3 adenylate cyclase/predicted ATPase